MDKSDRLQYYDLKEKIGMGGFGEIYRAEHELARRDGERIVREVAIKIISPEHANKEDFITRFAYEASLVARLEHPHIVPLYDFWREPGTAYLVMRYIRGGSLADALDTSGAWEIEKAAQLLDDIADALHMAHRNQVVHQDIKPENILLDLDGNSYLTDFGIARDLGADINLATDPENIRHGSPKYISPEHLQREGVITARSDIYSLGVLMYEVLTGHPPFQSDVLLDLLNMQMRMEIPPLQDKKPDLPDALNYPIRQATLKDPVQRYESVLEFSADFRYIVSQLGSAATSIILPNRRGGTLDLPMEVFNPYKGLRPFKEGDAGDFYGRDALIASILQRLTESHEYGRFLAVVGPSGSGKSSVVRAGVLPRLRTSPPAELPPLYVATMSPGTVPMRRLEAAVLNIAQQASGEMMQRLTQDVIPLATVLEAALPEGGEMLLVVDQFEELFTITSEERRRPFLQTLYEALTVPNSRLRLLVTVRADFLDRPLNLPGWGTLFRERSELVPPMRPEELRAAIEKPADRAGLLLESGLVDALVADSVEQAGVLPLLQYTLSELYNRRDHLRLTLAAYRGMGGIAGALAKRAEEIYNQLDSDQQRVAQQLFPRLVTLGEGTEDTRRRVLLRDLYESAPSLQPMRDTVEAFADYRLLTTGYDSTTRAPTVEIAHEALIRRWGRLRGWLDDNRDALRERERLHNAAQQWEANKREASYLAAGVRLNRYEALLDHPLMTLSALERAYLQASLKQERARERRRRRIQFSLATLTVAALVAAAIAVILGIQAEQARGVAVRERDRADEQANIARSRELATSALLQNPSAPDTALLLSVEALAAYPSYESRNNLLELLQVNAELQGTFQGHAEPLRALALGPDGRWLVSGDESGALIVWERTRREPLHVLQEHRDAVRAVAFSPDGTRFASVALDDSVILWEPESGEVVQRHDFDTGDGRAVAFSPDGQWFAAADTDGVLRLFDPVSGDLLEEIITPGGAIYSLAFHPTEPLLATGSNDAQVRLWNLDTLEEVATLSGHTNWVLSLAFRPDGSMLASAGADLQVRLWDIASEQTLVTFSGHTNWVWALSFADERSLLSAGRDGVVFVWDVQQRQNVGGFRSYGSAPIYDLATEGSRVWYAAESTTLYEVDRQPTSHLGGVLARQPEDVAAVLFVDDGRVASGGGRDEDFSVYLWDVASGEEPLAELVLHTGTVTDLLRWQGRLLSVGTDERVGIWEGETLLHSLQAGESIFAADAAGGVLALGLNSGDVQLWDVSAEDPQHWEPLSALESHNQRINDLAFNADGTRLLVASSDGSLSLWDMSERLLIERVDGAHENGAQSVAFHPDGQWAASGGRDQRIAFWQVTGEGLSEDDELLGHENWVVSLEFRPDGHMLASGSIDGTLRFWDVEERRPLGQPFMDHGDWVQAIAFRPDGLHLLSGGQDGRLFLWHSDPQAWRTVACTLANRRFSTTEERLYFDSIFPPSAGCE